jgi:hypothetical protein
LQNSDSNRFEACQAIAVEPEALLLAHFRWQTDAILKDEARAVLWHSYNDGIWQKEKKQSQRNNKK